MPPRALLRTLLAGAFSLVAACAKPPPAAPPEPVATSEPEVEKAPPAPPKCEALDEKCKAKDSTKAKIFGTELAFAPTTGWVYAQTDDGTVIQSSDEGAVFMYRVYEGNAKDAKKDTTAREEALAAILKTTGVALGPKRKINWRKADKVEAIGELKKVDFWEPGEGLRGAKKGALLLVRAPLADGKSVLGLGFVPDDDANSAEAIMTAAKSLAPGGAAAKEDGEGGDKPKGGKGDKAKSDKAKGDKAGAADDAKEGN